MNRFLRYLIRFKSATLLNLFGLTLAFASFLVIMMQVRYEYTYDKGYATADRLYRLNPIQGPGAKLNEAAPFMLVDELASHSPAIETISYRNCWEEEMAFYPVGSTYQHGVVMAPMFTADQRFPQVLGLKTVAGDFESFNHPKATLIAESIAKKLFPEKNPIGTWVIMMSPYGSDTIEITAVYRDLPINSSIKNAVIRYDHDIWSNWGTWNSSIFLTVRDPAQIPQIEQMASDLLREKAKWFYDNTPKDFCGVRLTRLSELYFSPDNPADEKGNRTVMYSLIAIALLIVGVAMVNFINFSLALIPQRIRHINTQKVLGSSRWALCRQQLSEMLGLTLIATLLSLWFVYYLSTTSFASLIDADMRLSVNGPLIGILFGMAVVTSLLAGIYPALYSTSFPPALILKGSFGLSLQGRRLRTGLIGFQYVVSLALTSIALFIYLQYCYMRDHEIGFHPDQLWTTWITLPMDEQKNALNNRLKSLPGVVDVAYSLWPFNDFDANLMAPYRGKRIRFDRLNVSSNFLSVMDIPVIQGRNFTPSDETGPGCYIFNQEAQRQFGLEVNEEGVGNIPTIGIAADFNYRPLYYPISPIALYVGREHWMSLLYCYIRILDNHSHETIRMIQDIFQEFDPDQGIISATSLKPLDQSLGSQYAKEDRLAKLIALFSLLAVLISTTGAFGLILLETRYRRKEIGLRKIFGATLGSLLWRFNQRYCWIVGSCFVIAAPIAYYVALHWRENFAYKAPIPFWIFAVALGIVWVITFVTVTLQSYRAAHENPTHAISE